MDAQPALNSTEIWQMETDFNHPLHLHLVHFRVLGHSGRPGPWDAGWKDTIDLGPGATANLLVRFNGYRGRYVFHCHNLEHEDMGMMGNFEVV
jgi:spore coat protein A